MIKTKHILSIFVLALVGTTSLAGESIQNFVTITIDSGFGNANGNQLAAKTSANDVEYIGCGVRNTEDGIFPPFRFGFCQAGDAAGNTVFCDTFNPNLIDSMRSISDYAYITFSWREIAPNENECIFVGSSTQSFYLPDKKAK